MIFIIFGRRRNYEKEIIILPQLFVVGAIIFIIVFIIKSIIKSGEKKETKRRAEYEVRMMDDSKE